MAGNTANIDIVLSNGNKAGQTLNELRQTANRLRASIGSLKPGSEEFIKQTQDYNKVTNRLKEVRDEVKGVSKDTGDLVKKSVELEKLEKRMADVEKETEGVRQATRGMMQELTRMVPFGDQIAGVGGKVKGLSGGFKTLKGAIISTGIGALIILIGTLATWISKTQQGTELWSKVTNTAGAVISVLIDRVTTFVDALIAFATWDFDKGVEKLKESFDGLGKEIAEETELTWKLQEALIAIEKKENDLKLARAASRAEIKELNKIAEDISKPYIDREQAAKRAIEIEQHLMDESIQNQKNKVANMLGLFELTDEKLEEIKKNGLALDDVGLSKSTEEDRKAAIDELARIFEMQSESLELQTTLQNKLNTISQQRAAQLEKERLAQEAINEELKAREAASQIEEIETIKVHEEFKGDTAKEIFERKHQEYLKSKQTAQEQEKNEAEVHAQELIRIEQDKMQATIGTLSTWSNLFGGLAAMQEKGTAQYKRYATAQAIMSTIQSSIEAYKSTAAIPIVGPALAPIAAATALAFGYAQVKAIQKTKADTSEKANKYEKGGVLKGRRHSSGGIPGIISSTGEPIEMEDGEIILNRNVGLSPFGRAAASNLNVAFGGRKFETGGVVNPLTSINPFTSHTMAPANNTSFTNSSTEEGNQIEKLHNTLAIYMNKVDEWARTIKVVNNVQKTEEGIQVINKLRNNVDV